MGIKKCNDDIIDHFLLKQKNSEVNNQHEFFSQDLTSSDVTIKTTLNNKNKVNLGNNNNIYKKDNNNNRDNYIIIFDKMKNIQKARSNQFSIKKTTQEELTLSPYKTADADNLKISCNNEILSKPINFFKKKNNQEKLANELNPQTLQLPHQQPQQQEIVMKDVNHAKQNCTNTNNNSWPVNNLKRGSNLIRGKFSMQTNTSNNVDNSNNNSLLDQKRLNHLIFSAKHTPREEQNQKCSSSLEQIDQQQQDSRYLYLPKVEPLDDKNLVKINQNEFHRKKNKGRVRNNIHRFNRDRKQQIMDSNLHSSYKLIKSSNLITPKTNGPTTESMNPIFISSIMNNMSNMKINNENFQDGVTPTFLDCNTSIDNQKIYRIYDMCDYSYTFELDH